MDTLINWTFLLLIMARPGRKTEIPSYKEILDTIVQLPLNFHDYGLNMEITNVPEVNDIKESLCGGNDSQDVELYDGSGEVSKEFVLEHQAPVGQLHWNSNLVSKYDNPGNVNGMRWTSGTLISDDLLLTAGHSFDRFAGNFRVPLINGSDEKIPPPEIATNMHVNFNYQFDSTGSLRQEQSFQILELLEYRINNLDYAIVRLNGRPGQTFGHAKISESDARLNDIICIIGHPQTLPKRLEAGHCTTLSEQIIGYNDIDTLGGDSGSCILSRDSGKLVGVHTNGGCDVAHIGFNRGQRISFIIDASNILNSLNE